MPRPRRIDSFMVNNEFEMLECRLTELDPCVDFFIAVEADVDHQDHPKPYHISDNFDRFTQWKDKLIVVKATGLPNAVDFPNPWAREHAQREHVHAGLAVIDVQPDDIIFHGDIDEIPNRLWARNVKPNGAQMVGCRQVLYSFAVDWEHPVPWGGTVAGRYEFITSFRLMREQRNFARPPGAMNPDTRYGWHLSWLGGTDAQLAKLGSFCHPEVADRIHDGLAGGHNRFLEDGIHADLQKMKPVDVDHTWPEYVYKRRCPESWFRPR